jgi:two-component sensor histidine kinase
VDGHDGGKNKHLRLNWQERHHDGVQASEKKTGFGTSLIQRTVEYELGGSFDRKFGTDGCTALIDVPWTREVGRQHD